ARKRKRSLKKPNCSSSLFFLNLSIIGNDHGFYIEELAYFLNRGSMMPSSQCKMVGGAFLHPPVEKGPDIGLEKTTRIGISRSWNGTRDGLSLRYDKLKSSIVRTADAQHRNRSFLDFKFYPGSKAWFAVVLFETSQH